MRSRTVTPPPPPRGRPFPVADRTRDGDLYESYHPRLVAIRHLRDLLQEGRAGVDPHDETVFVLDVRPHEQAWARTAVEMTGLFLSEIRSDAGGFCRYRMILEADVRLELGVDIRQYVAEPAETDGELVDLFEARELALAAERLEHPTTPLEQAIHNARNAQQQMLERSVH